MTVVWGDELRELRLREVAEAGDNVRRRWIANKAYEMRLAPTLGESAMQTILDETDYYWYPQCVIGRYIVDFYCPALDLIVEVDGSAHRGNEARDARRQAWLQKQGLNGFRTTNKALMVDSAHVAAELNDWLRVLVARQSA